MSGTADFEAVRSAVGDHVILDVRNRDEVETAGQINSSHNVPLPEVESAFDLNDSEFERKYGFAKPAHDADIITHCMKGGRAQRAADTLVRKGYTNVKVYPGSFSDWTAQGGEIIKPGTPFKPE